MLAYQYDRAGMFAGTTEADESPLEPGVFLLPARCTVAAPPNEWPDDQWPRWNGAAWQLVPRPAPAAKAVDDDPAAKIRQFLEDNPEVAAYLAAKQGGV